jgi:hypothetical protein
MLLLPSFRRYHVSKRRIIPLPMYKVDPAVHPDALFKLNQVSTCCLSKLFVSLTVVFSLSVGAGSVSTDNLLLQSCDPQAT